MKRRLRLGVIIAALVLPVAAIAAPPTDNARGPSCADFQGTADYTTNTSGQAVLSVTVTTESGEPACADGRYVVTATDSSGTIVATRTFFGDGSASFFQDTMILVTGNPTTITLTIESFRKGKNPLDTATATLLLDGGTGATSFR